MLNIFKKTINLAVEKKDRLRIYLLRRKIKVASLEETIDKIKKDNCSISRFGDGEFYIMEGRDIRFQEYNESLAKKLKEVFLSNEDNHLVCISNAINPKNYKEFTKKHKKWLKNYFKNSATYRLKYIDINKKYYNPLISRFWIPFEDKERARKIASSLKCIWKNRDVVIVEGEKTRMGVGNDLLKETNSVKRILCPPENAFSKYEKILNSCLEMPKNSLFLIALGPTASVLAYNLYKNGYQALDIGHIDLEYEWMKMGALEQVNLPNKYVNELEGGNIVNDISNDSYQKEVWINVTGIKTGGGRIEVYFETSDSLKEYFTGKQFFCEYSEPIETVPQAVAVIPFIVNVLPIVWLFNAELHLPELEKNFFESIDNIKSGYKNMYPEAMFLGKIKVDNIVDCSYVPSRKCSSFFSGGLDAIHTLIRHAEEKPDLITIWGSDLGLNDTAGWENVKSAVEDFGNIFNLKNVYIKSSFTEFIEERKLSYKFWNVIHGFWYHNIQHGIGMLGLTAPYVYKNKICTHYIGSSYSGKNKVECASDPTIDNQLKLASCKIVHDAYGYTRQDKIKEVIDYSKKTGINIPLRVCWTIKDGTNCCNCEKCFRTITGLLIEGADPKKYNFNTSEPIYKSLKKYMTIKHQCDSVTLELWHDIQERFYKNKKELRRNHILYKYIRWIDGFDFSNIKNNKEYKLYRLKGKFFSIVCKIAPRSIKEFAKKYINIYDN